MPNRYYLLEINEQGDIVSTQRAEQPITPPPLTRKQASERFFMLPGVPTDNAERIALIATLLGKPCEAKSLTAYDIVQAMSEYQARRDFEIVTRDLLTAAAPTITEEQIRAVCGGLLGLTADGFPGFPALTSVQREVMTERLPVSIAELQGARTVQDALFPPDPENGGDTGLPGAFAE